MESHPLIRRAPLPRHSLIASTLDRLDLAEAMQVMLDLPRVPAVRDLVRMPNTPRWVHTLTYLRDAMLRPLGFRRKNHQPITDNTPDFRGELGERRGAFTVIACDRHEIVLGQEDPHQSVRLGYRVHPTGGQTLIQINTAVQFHTLMGELYFGTILPLQREIVRADLANLSRELRGLPDKYERARPAPKSSQRYTEG